MTEENNTLIGKVINQDSLPLSEVIVSIISSPEPVPDVAAITNENGEFSFGYLKNGDYEIRFIFGEKSTVRKVSFKSNEKKIIFKLE
jgi:hypothetical protein